MKGDLKFLALLLIVMPFGIGSSFLIAPNKLLQALPGGYGEDLSLVQGDSRRYMNDWFGEILNLVKISERKLEDSQTINLAGNVEIKIPPDILLKIREGRDERGQPILNEISAPLPDIVQADMSGVKRAKAPQITRFELSPQPLVKSSLSVYQIKSEEIISPVKASINLSQNKGLGSESKGLKLHSGSHIHSEGGFGLEERPLAISLVQPEEKIAETKSVPLKRQMKPISASFSDVELSNSPHNSVFGEKLAFKDVRSNQQIPNQYVSRPANGEPDSRMSKLKASPLSRSDKELNVVLPELISAIDLRVPQGNRTQSASDITAELGALGYAIENETVTFHSGALARSSRLVMEFEQNTTTEHKVYLTKGSHKRGMLYYWGNTVPKNLEKAAEWFRIAANKGDVRAQYKLGIMALLGQGMRRNYTKAAKWLKMASKQDHPAAQYNLGLLYFAGHGVPKDDLRAYSWFDRSATLGDKHAKKARDTLRNILPAEYIQN